MQINFYPSWDKPEYEIAAKEYSEIWAKQGKRIIETIEKISGLNFREKVINAVTFGGHSYSAPLQLQSKISVENKKGSLVHELCHRLLLGNNISIKLPKDRYKYFIEVHKPVMLILYDIWIELFGEDYAKKQIEYEISEWDEEGTSPYKIVWDWALKMTKEQRQKEFRKYFKK